MLLVWLSRDTDLSNILMCLEITALLIDYVFSYICCLKKIVGHPVAGNGLRP